MIALWLGKFAFGRWLSRIPRSVWIKVAIAAAILISCFVVYRIIDGKIDTAFTNGKIAGREEYKLEVEKQTKKVETKSVAISTKIRSKTDEKNRVTAGVADAVRLRGPGKASYQCSPVAGGSTGGRVASSGQADAPVASVPGDKRSDLIVVPFADLVTFAEEHDLNITEIQSWRENQLKQTELVNQLNK